VGVLRRIGEKHFAPLMEKPEARALWWPRFQRIARWFAEWEAARRGDITAIAAEIGGEIKIPLDNNRTFTLSARADRIERRATAALPSSTTRPGNRRPESRSHGTVAAAHAGGAILREGGLPISTPAPPSANSPMSG
jgi:RecB family exonuclease